MSLCAFLNYCKGDTTRFPKGWFPTPPVLPANTTQYLQKAPFKALE